MTIKKLGNQKYFIRMIKHINKKRHERKFTGVFLTIGAARAKEKELEDQLLVLKEKMENEASCYTWQKAMFDYSEFSKENHRLNTHYNRMKVLEVHTASLNSLELAEIDKKIIRELIDSAKCSNSHKREVLKYIRQVFEIAVDNRRILVNPAKNIKLIGEKQNQEKANILLAMTQEEVRTLFNYMQGMNHDWYPIFYVTYQLGLRSSEAAALEYEDINWEKSHVVISKSWCKRKRGFVPPKNGTSRIVPMNNQLKLFLRERSMESNNTGFILPRFNSWLSGGASKVLQGLQKELKIRSTNYHSLRASFITHLLRNGMSVVSVQAMVGHRDLATTQRYIRLDATDLQEATSSLEIQNDPVGQVLNFERQ